MDRPAERELATERRAVATNLVIAEQELPFGEAPVSQSAKTALIRQNLWCPFHGDKRIAQMPAGPLIFCRWCMRMRWGLPEPRPPAEIRADIKTLKELF